MVLQLVVLLPGSSVIFELLKLGDHTFFEIVSPRAVSWCVKAEVECTRSSVSVGWMNRR